MENRESVRRSPRRGDLHIEKPRSGGFLANVRNICADWRRRYMIGATKRREARTRTVNAPGRSVRLGKPCPGHQPFGVFGVRAGTLGIGKLIADCENAERVAGTRVGHTPSPNDRSTMFEGCGVTCV